MKNKSPGKAAFPLSGLSALLSLCALLSGVGIYLFFRPAQYRYNQWTGLSLPDHLAPGFTLPVWMVYSLPEGLWAFAYSLIITDIWHKSTSPVRYFWIVSIPVLVLGSEFLQLAGMIPGTFSFTDLACGFTGLVAGYMVGKHKPIKTKHYETL